MTSEVVVAFSWFTRCVLLSQSTKSRLCKGFGCSTSLKDLVWMLGYLKGFVAAFVQVVQGSSSLHAVEPGGLGGGGLEHWNKSVIEAQAQEKLRWLLEAHGGFPLFLTWCFAVRGVRCPAAFSPAARCCGGARPWVYPGSRCAGALHCRPAGTKHHQNTRSTPVSVTARWLPIRLWILAVWTRYSKMINIYFKRSKETKQIKQ